MILISTFQNVLFYVALEKKNLSHLEPIRNSEPIFVILVAFLVFPSERNILVLILGLIVSFALIISHIEKHEIHGHKLTFDKYTFIVLLSMLVSGFLHVGYKYSLNYFSPITLYACRAIGVSIILLLIFKPKPTLQ